MGYRCSWHQWLRNNLFKRNLRGISLQDSWNETLQDKNLFIQKMITQLLSKFGFPALLLVAAFGAGMYVFAQFFAPEPVDYEKLRVMIANEISKIPKTECPPAVSLQGFDVSKFNNKKGTLNYNPQLYNPTIIFQAKDSLLWKQMLREAR